MRSQPFFFFYQFIIILTNQYNIVFFFYNLIFVDGKLMNGKKYLIL